MIMMVMKMMMVVMVMMNCDDYGEAMFDEVDEVDVYDDSFASHDFPHDKKVAENHYHREYGLQIKSSN